MMYPDEYAKKAGRSMSDKLSPENQDKMGMVYLEEDGYSKFKSGNMSAKSFAHNVAGTWAAMPTESGASVHAGVGSNKALVGYDAYMAQIQASKLQTGGAVNVSGSGSYSGMMVSKSQEMFAKKIAESVTPVVIPMPSGGGGGGQAPAPGGVNTPFPNVPAEDSSLVALEYKLKRVTWGDNV